MLAMPDYSYYREVYLGNTVNENDFPALFLRARAIIHRETLGQDETAPECMQHALYDCTCALIDALAAGHFASDGVQSFTNDGYSETRVSAKESRAALRSLLAQYLTVPVNLLGFAGHAIV